MDSETVSIIKSSLSKVSDQLKANASTTAEHIKAFENRLAHVEQTMAKARQGGGSIAMAGGVAKLAASVTGSSQYSAFRDGSAKDLRIAMSMPLASLVSESGQVITGDGTVTVQPQKMPGLFGYQSPPTRLLDLIPKVPTTSNSVVFNKLLDYTNAADYQLGENTAKAEASVTTEPKTAWVATIAHWLEVSEQVLADEPLLQQSLTRLLSTGVADKLERELILGDGSEFKISGLIAEGLPVSGTGYDKLPDAVGAVDSNMRAQGYVPSVVLINPTEWQQARSERAEGDGQYVAGGWASPAPPTIWQIPVVPASSVPVDKTLVIDLSRVAMLDRMQIVVEAFRDAELAKRNMVLLRAEVRAGLMVLDEAAVRIILGDFVTG